MGIINFHVNICRLVRAQRVWKRLCQIWLHRVFGVAGAHLPGLNQLFLRYSILSESVWPVLLQPYIRPEASGQAHTWPTCPLTRVVHGASVYAEIRPFCWMSGAPQMTPVTTFSIIVRMLAYGLDAPQTSTITNGSSQMDNWLPKYGHIKLWGDEVLQKKVYNWVTCLDIDLISV